MFGIENYIGFLLAGILLNITPGQDTIYIIGRSIAQGRRAGIASALGIATGCVVHTVAAAFGLSIILFTSPMVFNVVKFLGAVYLAYLGIQLMLRTSKKGFGGHTGDSMPISEIYRKGILTNILNPKVALFFIAFLPQFAKTQSNHGVLPFLILGITFIVTGTIWCLILAHFSSYFSNGLRRNPSVKILLDRSCGFVFIALGIKLLLSKR